MKMSKRDQTIMKMMKMANELLGNYTYDKCRAIWDMCSDWNSKHEGSEEIFMCEYQSDDSEFVNGFMIEDDIWVFED